MVQAQSPRAVTRLMFATAMMIGGVSASIAPGSANAQEKTPAAPTAARVFAATISIFDGANPEASARHRVLFDNGLFYDLPQIDPSQVTIYDPDAGVVTLLDRPTQTQISFATEDLIRFTAQARAAAAANPAGAEQIGLDAQVVPSRQMTGPSIKFGGTEYHVSTQRPAQAVMAKDFGRFSDLACRLNLLRRVGAPPFARMTLNDHLTAAGEIPLEMTLTLTRNQKKHKFRSTVLLDSVTQADRTKIDEVRGMMTLYRSVSAEEFPEVQ